MGVPCILLDPADLAAQFAAPDEEGEVARSKLAADIVTPLLERLPQREREIVFLYFTKGRRQHEIASLYGLCQSTVSKRLRRALERMRFMAGLPRLTEEALRFDLGEMFDARDVEILVGMWRSGGQTVVASRLRIPLSTLHGRLYACIERLEDEAVRDERWEPYARAFGGMREAGWNILRATRAAKEARRVRRNVHRAA